MEGEAKSSGSDYFPEDSANEERQFSGLESELNEDDFFGDIGTKIHGKGERAWARDRGAYSKTGRGAGGGQGHAKGHGSREEKKGRGGKQEAMRASLKSIEEQVLQAMDEYERLKEVIAKLKVVNSLLHNEVCKEYKELKKTNGFSAKLDNGDSLF